MDRHAQYVDASVNRYAQMNDFSGQSHFPSRADGRQHWDNNPQIELNPMSPHSYQQGRGNAAQEHLAGQKVNYENQANNDPRYQSYEEDMEIGYEDNKPSGSPLEQLEQKFQDEIMKLIKELGDDEDAENTRHRERIIEINTRYQANLSSLRAQHTTRIGELLRKESQARLHQYQQAETSTHLTGLGPGPSPSPQDYGWPTATDAPRPYGTSPNDSYREQAAQYRGARRSQDSEVRVPYPPGRVYNNSSARYY